MKHKLPEHVAIVMDGNGRWAERRGLARVEGHRAGIEAVKSVIQSCIENKVAILSLFAFSSENWTRPGAEVDFLMRLFIQALQQEIHALHEHGVSLRFIGDRKGLTQALAAEMEKAEKLTMNNSRLILNVAVNYSGKWDIIQAVQTLLDKHSAGQLNTAEVDDALFAKHLSTRDLPEPDLLIRTSGELRVSNFFLWQLAYTELYFTDVHWPDFTASEFAKALSSFGLRNRRFGRVSTQQSGKDYV